MEMRTILDIEPLKQFFLLLLQAKKTDLQQKKQDLKRSFVVAPIYNASMKQRSWEAIGQLSLPVHQFVSFSIEIEETQFAGYLLLSEDTELHTRFLTALNFS